MLFGDDYAAPTACVTKNTCGSRSSPACCRPCNGQHTLTRAIVGSRGITFLPPPRCCLHADRTRRPADIAVDMMDNASALPTCPQRQQQKKTAV